MDIEILPPWWRTWWAFGVYGLLFVVCCCNLFCGSVSAEEGRRERAREDPGAGAGAGAGDRKGASGTARNPRVPENHAAAAHSTGETCVARAAHRGIAHEIKNPLNFVNNFAQIAATQAEEIESVLENEKDGLSTAGAYELKSMLDDLKLNAQKINEHGQQADGIIRFMLEHSRTGTGERRVVNLNKLVDEYVNLAYHGVRAREDGFEVELEKEYDKKIAGVEICPQEIGRVLINLLDNAFYTVNEKRLSVNGQYIPRVSVSTKKVHGRVEVRIKDNGVGIPEDILDNMFEPFFTTKPAGSGTGLGLSLSYDIVTHGHGGRLDVESTEGEGATFLISLPVSTNIV